MMLGCWEARILKSWMIFPVEKFMKRYEAAP